VAADGKDVGIGFRLGCGGEGDRKRCLFDGGDLSLFFGGVGDGVSSGGLSCMLLWTSRDHDGFSRPSPPQCIVYVRTGNLYWVSPQHIWSVSTAASTARRLPAIKTVSTSIRFNSSENIHI
jgi:hypothetical protein